MNRSLPDDWLYDRIMLQLLGAAGTVNNITLYYIYESLTSQVSGSQRQMLITFSITIRPWL